MAEKLNLAFKIVIVYPKKAKIATDKKYKIPIYF